MAKRVHTPEFKREAVRLASKPGLPKAQVARELGIHPNVLKTWCEKFKSGKWEVKPGDKISQGDPVVEINTEKASAVLDSDFTGEIVEILFKPGDMVEVGTVICRIKQV